MLVFVGAASMLLGRRRHLVDASRKLCVVGHQIYESCQHERQVHGRVLPVL